MGTIRTEQTRLLQENGTENIEFFVYDKDGVAKSTLNQIKNVLKQIPSIMEPVNSNLAVEYLRPLKDAIMTTVTEDNQLLNKNPNFRYNTFDWNITTSKAIVAIPSQIFGGVKPISGIYCLYQEVIGITDEKTTHMIKNILETTPVVSGREIQISYNYQVVTLGFTAQVVRQYMSIGLDSTNNGTINKMYNFEENKFETGTFTEDKFFKKFDITQFDSWVKNTTTIQSNLTAAETNPKIEVKLFAMSGVGLSPRAYYDGFSISQKPSSKTRKQIRRRGNFFSNIDGVITNEEENISGEYKQNEIIFSNEVNLLNTNSIIGEFTRKDRPLSIGINTLDKCVLQEIINDFRKPIKRYEGEFYKNDNDVVPIYFYHKLWVNFGSSILQEPVSAIIDEMEFDVKQNVYRIIMHIPNADDDKLAYSLYKLD